MKAWSRLIFLKLAIATHSGSAQDTPPINQLTKLRSLQNQISQNATETPKSDSKAKANPWNFSLGSGMTYTTNANLTPGSRQSDFYATNIVGLRRQSDLSHGFAFSSGLEITDFRYFRSPGLSMTFLDWDLMLSWSGTASDLELEGYLSHTFEWTQQRTFKSQTFSNILALGGSVTRQISPGHRLSGAAELSATPYTSPSENAYGGASLSTSYEWTVTPSIALKMSLIGYETWYFSGQRDFTMSCGATITWSITPWLSLAATSAPTWNFSTAKASNYTAVDSGFNVSGNWKF